MWVICQHPQTCMWFIKPSLLVPSHGALYLEFAAHPAINIPYDPNDDTANIKKIPNS